MPKRPSHEAVVPETRAHRASPLSISERSRSSWKSQLNNPQDTKILDIEVLLREKGQRAVVLFRTSYPS